jgi:hypothetical protein
MRAGPRLARRDQPVSIETDDDHHVPSMTHALAEVQRDYPGWEAWPGVVAGVLYARRPRTSPPMVVRAITTIDLRQAIENAERERGLR